MSSSAEHIITSVVDSINDHLDNSKSVNVFAAPARMPIVNNFALIFYNTFLQTIDDYDLSRNDIRVLLKIIELMKFGNLVRISWADVAKSLKIPQKNITRHIKKLRNAKLLVDDNGNTYLNPQIIAKGKFLQKAGDDTLLKILDLGAKELAKEGIDPNIITPKMQQASLLEQIQTRPSPQE